MTTYATLNPIGSKDPRDLLDNAENLDDWSLGEEDTYLDRLGRTRKSMRGMENEFDAAESDRQARYREAIESTGFEYLGDYAAGVTFTGYQQVVRHADELYGLSAAYAPPVVLAGVWATDSAKLVSRGDNVLRADLLINGGIRLRLENGDLLQKAMTFLETLNYSTFEQRNSRPIELVAHRGFMTQAPQNTALAFSSALSAGADALECDVAVSADGEYFMFHDTTVDSLTTGTGTFTSLSSAYLDSLELKSEQGTRFAPVRLSRFSEYLEIARTAGAFIYPEFKRYRSTADLQGMIDLIVEYGMDSACCMGSFSLNILNMARAANKNMEVGLLGVSTSVATVKGYIDQVAALGKGSLIWDYDATLAIPEAVAYAFSKGVDWGVYTVDRQSQLPAIRKLGIRRIISNVSLKVSQ